MAVDTIYWAKTDCRFLGAGGVESRLGLSIATERHEMEGFMQRRLADENELHLELQV